VSGPTGPATAAGCGSSRSKTSSARGSAARSSSCSTGPRPHLNKPDNIDIDTGGNLLIQEDPGNNAHVSRIVAYDTATGARGVLATFDPDRFAAGSANLSTLDEESSGIIDAKHVIGPGWFLFDAQVHKPTADPASVELGQLLAMKVDSFRKIYDSP
jgi:hypothetical protein